MHDQIRKKVETFVIDNFVFDEDSTSLSATDSLLETGLLDSTGVLELVGYLEEEFGLSIDDDEIVPENLDSIQAITVFVAAKFGAKLANAS